MSPKTKILYFHHSIGLGGAPRSLSFLIKGLDKKQFAPVVAMPKRPGNDAVVSMFREAGAEVIQETDIRPFHGSTVAKCDSFREKAYSILSYNRLVKCAKKVFQNAQPDLVHLNSTCLVGAAKGVHLAKPSIPVVAHVREPLLQNRWGRFLAKLNRKHVNWFVAIDQFGLESIGGDAANNGEVIYNFVDRSVFCQNETAKKTKRAELGWKPDDVVVLSLSRVSKSNGALELAELIRSCQSRLPSCVRFAFAGFHQPIIGYAEKAASVIAELECCESLDFESDPVLLLNAADVVVAPFVTPHSARSVFEGAAMGKPALVSDLPNLAELIQAGQTGFKFSLDSEQEFLNGVNQLSKPNLRQEFGQAAVDFAKERFDQSRNVLKTVEVYERLLSGVC